MKLVAHPPPGFRAALKSHAPHSPGQRRFPAPDTQRVARGPRLRLPQPAAFGAAPSARQRTAAGLQIRAPGTVPGSGAAPRAQPAPHNRRLLLAGAMAGGRYAMLAGLSRNRSSLLLVRSAPAAEPQSR